jgi:hypothetical protein
MDEGVGSSVVAVSYYGYKDKQLDHPFPLLAVFRNANVMIIQSKTTPETPISFPPLICEVIANVKKGFHLLPRLTT